MTKYGGVTGNRPYWRISDPPYGGLQADQRGNAWGVQGNNKGFHFGGIPRGGTPGEFPGVHQPWGNEQERNTLPLYRHGQGAMQLLDGKPSLMSRLV